MPINFQEEEKHRYNNQFIHKRTQRVNSITVKAPELAKRLVSMCSSYFWWLPCTSVAPHSKGEPFRRISASSSASLSGHRGLSAASETAQTINDGLIKVFSGADTRAALAVGLHQRLLEVTRASAAVPWIRWGGEVSTGSRYVRS